MDAQNITYNENGDLVIKIDSYNRVGGAIESNDYYESGSFEFVGKMDCPSGATMAFWTFYNEDDGNVNHEIDFELYGKNTIMYSCYTSEKDVTTIKDTLDYTIYDNEYHTYRFNWYSGDRVEFYIDDVLVATITENIPTRPMKVWIGAWCPTWSGEPVQGEYTMTVQSFRYTAFN